MKITKRNYHKFLRLKPIQKTIIDCILDYAHGDKCFSFPSQETIADKINVSRHTVLRQLKKIEEFTLAGKSFVVRYNQRDPEGKFDHTVYLFPWIDKTEEYTKALEEDVLNNLITEYHDQAMQELELEVKCDSHVAKSNSKVLERSSFYLSLSEKINKIKEYSQSKAEDVLKVLIRIGNVLTYGNPIYDLEKYLLASLKDIQLESKGEKALKELYNILIGGYDIYEIDLDGYINDLMKAF